MAKPKTTPKSDAVVADVALPASVRLVRQHSFIDDNGAHRMWLAGAVVTDAADIALLISRKAELVESA